MYPIEQGAQLRLVYRIDSNEYQGNCRLQLMIEYIELVENR